jgi:ribosomal protein L40E
MQFVSVKDGNVIGYLATGMKRPENIAESISLLNFDKTGKTKMVFANDIKCFFKYLIDVAKVRKINWSVFKGNPAINQYIRWAKSIGAYKVGTFKNETLIDGYFVDSIHYEWINDYYECTHCGAKNKFEAEVMCWKCGKGEMVYKSPFGE